MHPKQREIIDLINDNKQVDAFAALDKLALKILFTVSSIKRISLVKWT
jgi:hypothetical protein